MTLEENIPESSFKGKKRVQLKHLVLDCDFFEKPKVIAIRYKFKHNGVLALIDCLCKMSKGTDGEIPTDCARAIAQDFDIEDPDTFVKYCLSLGIFIPGSSDIYITNARVQDDQEAMALKQEEWREKKKPGKSRESQGNLRGISGEKTENLLGSVNTELLNTEDLNVLDSSLKGAGKLSSLTPEAFEAVKRWGKHRAKLKKPFDAMAAEALQMQYAGKSADLIRDINSAIAGNWMNIRPLPPPDKPNAVEPPKSMQRRNLENLQKVLNGENPWENDPVFGAIKDA